MKNISNYIQHLDFDYAITYSGLRGEKFLNLEIENKKQIQLIEKGIKPARFMKKSIQRKKIEKLKDEINIYNSLIINKDGELHKSTEKVQTFKQNSEELKSIFKILNSKIEKQVLTTCSPVFRDSIAFYSKEHKIVGLLQICFSCWWIENEKAEVLRVDPKIFPLLKAKFMEIGHQIEDNRVIKR